MSCKFCFDHVYIVCVWYVGPLCSKHWSTSLPGHSMQHDPSSNQPVIDPVVLLWIPMAHWVYMYVWVCVCVSSTSSFGWAPSGTSHLTPFHCIQNVSKGHSDGHSISLYLHASIFTLFFTSLVSYLFFSYTVRGTYPTPDETSLLSVRFLSDCGAGSPGDQIALWFYVDESKSQLLQVVSMLRHARLSSHFERLAHHKRAHFTSIQFETDREKRGVPSERLSLAFGGRLAAARKLSDPPKKKKHTYSHYISTCMAKSTHTSIQVNTYIRTHTIRSHTHAQTSIRASSEQLQFLSASVAVYLQFKELWVLLLPNYKLHLPA